jgi:hypothetical protein
MDGIIGKHGARPVPVPISSVRPRAMRTAQERAPPRRSFSKGAINQS